MKVLIVEDERLISMMERRILMKLGHAVLGPTSSALEAMAILENETADLILMDIRLEGAMDGIEAASIIKKKWGIPLVFASAFTDPETRERAEHLKPLALLAKPLRMKDIQTITEGMLVK